MKLGTGRTLGAVLALALFAGACGGSSGDEAGGGVSADSADGAQQAEAPGSAPTGADDPIVMRASALAISLVEHLGDDDTAAGALLLAGDAGYSALQIEAAINRGALAPDGTVADVLPALEPYGLIEGFHAMIISQDDEDDLLPIERLRREAAEEAGRDDDSPSGALATSLILQWQFSGYSQRQIVDMLIFGVETLDDNYQGELAEGEEECGGYVIGGVHEIPQFCDPESGELFRDDSEEDETADDDEAGQAAAADSAGDEYCGGDFAPPYTLAIEPAGVMLETQVLGPLETPYYWTEVSGLFEISSDGLVKLTAHTVRYADITIRDEPDNQIYIRDFNVQGSLDLTSGDGDATGTASGSDQLWAAASASPTEGEVSGQLAIVCDEDEPSGFAIFGFVSGTGGVLEFEARP